MAFKPTLFLASIVVLLVTRMGSCVEENLYNMSMTIKPNHSYRLANVSTCTPVQTPSSASAVQPPSAAPILPPSAAPAHAPSTASIASPTNAPSNSPTPTPTKASIMAPVPVPAPAQAPSNSSACGQSNSPAYPNPRNPPVYQRAAPPRACVSMCASYCKATSPKRPCMGICTACCGKMKCVPGFNNCTNWDTIIFRGHLVKCP